jgi:hypothetical protein
MDFYNILLFINKDSSKFFKLKKKQLKFYLINYIYILLYLIITSLIIKKNIINLKCKNYLLYNSTLNIFILSIFLIFNNYLIKFYYFITIEL